MPRVLFVDDEPNIRATMPDILRLHGYDVFVAASVSEALSAIVNTTFDVLISDLNIGEPGDGFTVVSAMRRVQPKCRTFIITGFPAFETALIAIRAQVDDYIVKPANIPEMVASIESTLKQAQRELRPEGKRLSEMLRKYTPDIVSAVLACMKANAEISAIPLSDDERVDHIPALLADLAEMLESRHPDETPETLLQSAGEHGTVRQRVGYSVGMLVEEARLLLDAVNNIIQANLLAVDMSHLVEDLKWLDKSILRQLREAVEAYEEAERDIAA